MTKLLSGAALALAGTLSLVGCGGSGSSSTPASPAGTSSTTPASTATAPADPAAAKAQITSVWVKFFNSGTSRAEAAGVLEDGDQLGAALKLAAKEDKASHLNRKAKVQLIRFISPTTASVTWTLLNGKTPLLPNASGQAVLVAGQWKVSKLTFCTLVELGNNNKPVPGCS
ncbi:MAG TPA: hypothetical protein VFT62_00450 [Mycobacteriales bacterium]|nr:hypothetical protein [Mycobacteriales bacterium]